MVNYSSEIFEEALVGEEVKKLARDLSSGLVAINKPSSMLKSSFTILFCFI